MLKRNIANYRAVPQDRYGKRFIEYSLGTLFCVFNYRKNFIFNRTLLSGLALDPMFSPVFVSMRDDAVRTKDLRFAEVLDVSSREDIRDKEALAFLEEFIQECVERTSLSCFHTKQYVICRAMITGLSKDSIFSSRFESLKKGYVLDVVKHEGSDYGAVNFITDVLGKF